MILRNGLLVGAVVVDMLCLVLGVACANVQVVILMALPLVLMVPVRHLSAKCRVVWSLVGASIVRGLQVVVSEGVQGLGILDQTHLVVAALFALFMLVKAPAVRWGAWVVVLLGHAWMSWIAFSIPGVDQGASCAFLERGRWGVTHTSERELEIKSQYSYTLIKNALGAVPISSCRSLDAYQTLWMITPTEVFAPDEVAGIVDWVARGGHLVVVTDHTDLFGHASALSPLLSQFGIALGRDCVISEPEAPQPYVYAFGSFTGLTANTITGTCWPFLIQMGFQERADYNGRSFFSDNAVTDEDRAGVFCIGGFRRFGLGRVSVFGDSTLFADFAFSKPSAQMAFRMLRDGVYRLNFPLLACLLNLSVLCLLAADFRGRRVLVVMGPMLGAAYVLAWSIGTAHVAKARLIADESVQTVQTDGDWDLVDGENAEFSVLFATVFAQKTSFPEWRIPAGAKKGVRCAGRQLGLDEVKLGPRHEITSVLASEEIMSPADFIQDLLSASREDSLWFESGVGYFKNMAYEGFWEGTAAALSPELECSRRTTCDYYSDGQKVENVPVVIRAVAGVPEWCVLGDWIVGRMVDGNILVKDKWQHPHRRFGDLVLVIKGE